LGNNKFQVADFGKLQWPEEARGGDAQWAAAIGGADM
jgi:hypothetical protein